MTVYRRYKARIDKIAAQVREPNRTESFSRQDGGHQVVHSSLPNTDDDNTFGEYVYLAYTHHEGRVPEQNYTIPVLCSTSMAIAVAEMQGRGDCTIIRVHRDKMPEDAFRLVTQHGRMMADPAIRKMYERHIRQARRWLKRRKAKAAA